jgi:threonine/homoserine/homoserine lactone efflux protein
VLTAVPEMFIGLKVAGGLYLLWLGYKIYRGAAQPMDFAAGGMAAEHSLLKTFRDGLYTQLSNPKRRWCSPLFLPPCCRSASRWPFTISCR